MTAYGVPSSQGYVMMTAWLPGEKGVPNTLPPNASHQVSWLSSTYMHAWELAWYRPRGVAVHELA